jgi:hypothetical protein
MGVARIARVVFGERLAVNRRAVYEERPASHQRAFSVSKPTMILQKE